MSKRGRQASVEAATEHIAMRVRPSERERLEEIARANQKTVSEFLREAVNNAAADCSDEPVFIVVR